MASHNPDIYLLYEYMDKISFTLRLQYQLDEPVDPALLNEAAQEAIVRFPYYRVQVGLDAGQNYTLEPNERPLAVLPEEDRRRVLGSDEVNGHLFFISYRGNSIWFNGSHSFSGSYGLLFWIKATLYLYMTRKYGAIEAPKDLKLPGTPVDDREIFFPDVDSVSRDEPLMRYEGGDSNYAIGRMLKFLFNPFAKDNYYYEIEIPAKEFMDYAVSIDGSPNTVLTAMMFKAMTRWLKEKKGTFVSGRTAADYRKDIGAEGSYRDFVRLIHTKYEWSMRDESIQQLNLRARGAMIKQNQPELGCERFLKLMEVRKSIDELPTLKEKKKYALANSTFRSDPRDVYSISYVGRVDYGGLADHIRGIYTITDGDLMLEVNATEDTFYITYQLINKDRKPLDRFLEVLGEEGIPYRVSERKVRYLPKIQLPEPR